MCAFVCVCVYVCASVCFCACVLCASMCVCVSVRVWSYLLCTHVWLNSWSVVLCAGAAIPQSRRAAVAALLSLQAMADSMMLNLSGQVLVTAAMAYRVKCRKQTIDCKALKMFWVLRSLAHTRITVAACTPEA